MIKELFYRENSISREINDGSGDVAKKRLKNAISCERVHLTSEVNEMMQQDLKRVIENYIGGELEDSDLIVEIKNPDY